MFQQEVQWEIVLVLISKLFRCIRKGKVDCSIEKLIMFWWYKQEMQWIMVHIHKIYSSWIYMDCTWVAKPWLASHLNSLKKISLPLYPVLLYLLYLKYLLFSSNWLIYHDICSNRFLPHLVVKLIIISWNTFLQDGVVSF